MKFTAFILIGIVLQSVYADTRDGENHRCAQPIYKLEKNQEGCFAEIPRWGHHHQSGDCKSFNYDGCNKNDNHFETKEECERICGEWHKQHKDHDHGNHGGHDEHDCGKHGHTNDHSQHNHHHH